MIHTKETNYCIHGAPSFALLSDLHNSDPAPVITSLQRRKPAFIAIVGDILYGSQPVDDRSPLETQKNVLPLLTACASLAPTYLSLGNHEWMLDQEDLATLAATGTTVLDNNWKHLTLDGNEIILGGLTSGYVTAYRSFRTMSASLASTIQKDTPTSAAAASFTHQKDTPTSAAAASSPALELRYPRRDSLTGVGGVINASSLTPEMTWLSAYCAAPGYHILLCHHPEYYPKIPNKVDLMLSGHAHGGQWRLFGHGIWSPGQGWWPSYTKGVYDGRLIVSAGLSNTTWIPRIANPTELLYIN